MNFMKPALIALSVICLTICVFSAPRHKITPKFELLPGELDLSSTHSRERWRGTPQRVPPLFLPDGRMVVVAADSVYMLSQEGKQLWKYAIGEGKDPEKVYDEGFGAGLAVMEIAFQPARNELALVCEDNLSVRLDAATGKLKWLNEEMGPGEDLGVIAYGEGFLWRDNNGFGSGDLSYREEDGEWAIETPDDPEIFVNGDKIYCIERIYSRKTGRYRILLRELHPPLHRVNTPPRRLTDIQTAVDNGDFLRAQGKYQEAIASLDQVIQHNPDVAEAYYERGHVYYDLEQYDRAIQDYDQAIRLAPNYHEAYFRRGEAYRRLKQYERAIQDYTEPIRVAPEGAFKSYLARGDAYRDLGQDTRAIPDYGKAIRLAFSNYEAAPEAYAKRAETYFDLGEYERAVADYDQAMSFEPNDSKAWHDRGIDYEQLKRIARVRKHSGAARHRLTPKLELLPGERDLRSTHSADIPERIHPLILPDHRMVVVAADTVYMLSAEGKQLWRYATGEGSDPDEMPVGDGSAVIEITFNAALNELALLGVDSLTVLLDATTGKVKHQSQSNGPGVELSMLAYKEGYLRRYDPGAGSHPQDHLAYAENPSESGLWNVWDIDLPDSDAEIFVNRNKIYYMRRSYSKKTGRYRILLREFHPPLTRQESDDYGAKTISGANADAAKAVLESSLLSAEKRIASLDQTIRSYPNYAEAYASRAETYHTLRQYDRAIQDYSQAIRLRPDVAEYYRERANLYYLLEQPKLAIQDYDEAIRLDPENGHVARGQVYVDLGQKKRAFRDFAEAIRLSPEDASDVYMARGDAYREFGEDAHAIPEYGKAIRLLGPQPEEAYSKRAETYSSLGQYERAIADYDQIIRLDPDNYEAYAGRGSVYLSLKRYQQAIKDYNRAIRSEPTWGALYCDRGDVYRALGEYKRAIEDYDQAIRLDPNQWYTFYSGRGAAYHKLKQYQQAIQDYDQALRLLGADDALYFSRGVAYLDLKQYQNAIQDFDQFIGLHPIDADAYYNRGLAYKALKQDDRAQQDFDHAKKLKASGSLSSP